MAIVRKDKLLAGYNGNLESVQIYDNAGSKTVKVTNGVFVVVENQLVKDQREVKKARLAEAADADKDVMLIHNPEVMYDSRLYQLKDYVIEAGKVSRAYRLFDGDIITLTADLFADVPVDKDGKVVIGQKLAVKAGGKLGTYDDTKVTPKVVFTVIEDSGYELDMQMKAYAVQVTRN